MRTRWDPIPYSPIHDDDIAAQVEPLLGAASVPATIVNWCGDEAVSVQQWSAYFGELLGVEPRWWSRRSPAPRWLGRRPHQAHSITGPCRVGWRDGFRRMAEHFYPDQSGRDERGKGPRGTRASDSAGSPCPPPGRARGARYPTSEALLAEAVQVTGLSDFGPGDFREGLDVLLESLDRDADLGPPPTPP